MTNVSGRFLTDEDVEALLAAERERCAAAIDKWRSDWAVGLSDGAIAACETLASVIRNLPPQTEGGQP